MRAIGAMLVLVLTGAAPAWAASPAVSCPFRNDPPWAYARPVAAALSNPAPTFVLGEPAMISLASAAQVRFPAPLGKPVASGDKGGLVALRIAIAGTYRIAVGHKAWIDVIRDGKALAPVAHAHGEPCSGVAKTVDFALASGDYVIQISDTTDGRIGASVTKQP